MGLAAGAIGTGARAASAIAAGFSGAASGLSGIAAGFSDKTGGAAGASTGIPRAAQKSSRFLRLVSTNG